MKLYRTEVLAQMGPGEIFAFDESQVKGRGARVRVIEKAGDRIIVAANELIDIKAGEVIGLVDVPKNLSGKLVELKDAAPVDVGRKAATEVAGKGGDRTGKIVAAIARLNPQNPKHFRSDGLPAVAALEKATGFKLTSAERDEAWRRARAK